jgi:predicted HNH restriction endonuclease
MPEKFKCKDCGITGENNFYQYKYQCKSCWNKRTYQSARDKLDALIEERGGKCECCGYNKYYGALQWHHLDPTAKEFGISAKRGRPIEELRIEISKCKLLCANCHAEAHHTQ